MTGSLLADSRFRPLFVCQFLSVLCDNLLRNALGVVVLWSASAHGKHQEWMVAAAAGTFVAPSILFSGLGGELADRMDKARLIRALKLADLLVAIIAAAGLALGRLEVVFAALVGAGAVAALFGPVKYGILPDQFAQDQLAAANALVEGATFAAILAGTVGANLLAAGDGGGTAIAAIVSAGALLSWAVACMIPATVPAAPYLVTKANVLVSTMELLAALRKDRRSWRAALASAWFWMLGAAVLSLVPGLVRNTLGGGAPENGVFLGLFAMGVASGSALASFFAGGRIILVTAALGCATAGVSLLIVWDLTLAGVAQSWPLFLAMFVTSVGAGMLAVPVQAAVQAWSKPERRARAVGGMNVLAATGMVLTTMLLVAAQTCGVSEAALLGVVGLLCVLLAPVLLVTLPTDPKGESAWIILRLLFRIELHSSEYLSGVGKRAILAVDPANCSEAGILSAISGDPPSLLAVGMDRRFWQIQRFFGGVAAPFWPFDVMLHHLIRVALEKAEGAARTVIVREEPRGVVGWRIQAWERAEIAPSTLDLLDHLVHADPKERAYLLCVVVKRSGGFFPPKLLVVLRPPHV